MYTELLLKHFPFLTRVPVTSGNSTWQFGSDGVSKRTTKETLGRASTMLTTVWGMLMLDSRLGKGARGSRSHRTRPFEHEAAKLIIPTLERKQFDRPFYNTRLLRRLFAAYRNGNSAYHKLFALVFYIELWHQLFIDDDSSALFNPSDLTIHGD